MQQLTTKTKLIMFLTVVVMAIVCIIAGLEIPFWRGAFHAALGAGAMGLLIEMTRFFLHSKAKE